MITIPELLSLLRHWALRQQCFEAWERAHLAWLWRAVEAIFRDDKLMKGTDMKTTGLNWLWLIVLVMVVGCSMFSEQDIVDLWNGWDQQVQQVVTNVPVAVNPVQPDKPKGLAPDEIDITKIKDIYDGLPLNKLTQNVSIKSVYQKGPRLYIEYTESCPWTDQWKGAIGNCWLFLQREDGTWHGGPGDWLRPDPVHNQVMSNFKFAHDGKVWHIGDGVSNKWATMTSSPARNGVRDSGVRSNIKLMMVQK